VGFHDYHPKLLSLCASFRATANRRVLSRAAHLLAQEMASFSNAGFGAEPEEQAGLMGKASELAKGLRHPMPALFHVLFKVRHALQAHTHTPRQLTQSP